MPFECDVALFGGTPRIVQQVSFARGRHEVGCRFSMGWEHLEGGSFLRFPYATVAGGYWRTLVMLAGRWRSKICFFWSLTSPLGSRGNWGSCFVEMLAMSGFDWWFGGFDG